MLGSTSWEQLTGKNEGLTQEEAEKGRGWGKCGESELAPPAPSMTSIIISPLTPATALGFCPMQPGIPTNCLSVLIQSYLMPPHPLFIPRKPTSD